MNQRQAHRGPDGGGSYFAPADQVGLAHRRLSIIELSNLGHQPMWDFAKKAIIVFNGEIYNYRELRADLVARGCRFQSQSDTEVLLQLYLMEGEKMLHRLNGIFSFGIWDTEQKSLFLARDGLGVKPLYYSTTPKGFLFASELKSLLEEESVERAINPEAIQYHLTYLWSPSPTTMLKSVHKLEPGHALLLRDSKIQKKWKFYELPYDQPIRKVSEVTAIQEVLAQLKESVRKQMVSDVPVGAFLSGGLDSSSVVALAKNIQTDQKLQCFTIGLENSKTTNEGFSEDLPYAKAVAKHLDVDLHTIYVGSNMIDQLEKMIFHLDEPQADPAPLNVLFICQLARDHGIKVLLSGAGGDDIFTGYRRHFALMQERYWQWLPQSAKNLASQIAKHIPTRNPLARRLTKLFQYANLDEAQRIASYFFWIHPDRTRSLFSNALGEQLMTTPEAPLLRILDSLPDNIPALNQMLFLESKYFLADHNLNYTDKMSMATGVEVRVPLLDVDLVRLASQLPLGFKQRGRTGKWIFKKAMEPYLPKSVIYRPKTGFGAPLRYWIRNELRPMVEDLLSDSNLKKRDYFNPTAVRKLIDDDRSGHVDGSYAIFSLMSIELWARLFLDRRNSLPVSAEAFFSKTSETDLENRL